MTTPEKWAWRIALIAMTIFGFTLGLKYAAPQ